jgi:hypothetical protein
MSDENQTDLQTVTTGTNHNLNESADKIRLETQVKRGEGTRDEDRMKVKVRGDDPGATAARLRETLDALADEGVATELRATRAAEPEGENDEDA